MYNYLEIKFGKFVANLLIIIWYLFIIITIIALSDHRPGQFRYLHW